MPWRTDWQPSPKWAVARITAAAALITALIENDWVWSTTIQILGVGLVAEALTAYIAPNRSK